MTIGRRLLLILTASCLHAVGFADSKDLSLSIRPAFESLSVWSGAYPIVVQVSNDGQNTSGAVLLQSENYSMEYPLDLPRGSRKRFIAYAPAEDCTFGLKVRLETGAGSLEMPLTVSAEPANFAIGLIGGSIGDMTFLRLGLAEDRERIRAKDAYGEPGQLPDRPGGYSAFLALVLSEGAERMTDDEVQALKTWAVTGGSLVFIGGASPAVIADPRWSNLLPLTKMHSASVVGLPELLSLGGSRPPQKTISLTVGVPKPGAEVTLSSHRLPIVSKRPFGLGQIYYLSFNPFEQPLKPWAGWRKFFRNSIGLEESVSAASWNVGQVYRARESDFTSQKGPFNAKLPDAWTVFLILLIYFILAVPVNFSVLRRMGKSELVWVTAPVLSLCFAGVFFSFAGSLYGSGLSVRTQAVLLASKDHPEGYCLARSQLFFPKGGRYDLHLNNVDSAIMRAPSESDPMMYGYSGPRSYSYAASRSGNIAQPINGKDLGEIKIDDLTVSNLSFRELAIGQRVDTNNWFTGNIKIRNGDTFAGSIRNTSPYEISGLSVDFGHQTFQIGNLAKGEASRGDIVGNYNRQEVPWANRRLLVLHGTIQGFRPGPQIGSNTIENAVELVYVWGAEK